MYTLGSNYQKLIRSFGKIVILFLVGLQWRGAVLVTRVDEGAVKMGGDREPINALISRLPNC